MSKGGELFGATHTFIAYDEFASEDRMLLNSLASYKEIERMRLATIMRKTVSTVYSLPDRHPLVLAIEEINNANRD